MSSLDQLYQQVILDHDREKHGFGLREVPAPAQSAESSQYNPLCGDTVTMRVSVLRGGSRADLAISDSTANDSTANDSTANDSTANDSTAGDSTAVVQDVSWTGDGCSISQASVSVLHDLLVGRPVAEAEQVLAAFREMIRARGQVEPDEEVLGDGVAFAGVGRHANRVKCAMLGWTAFEDALRRLDVGYPGGEEKR
jgi:nitrogen fixation NifU-like protein